MWHSEDDLIKDLAVLNDFANPGDKESYKLLYSKGRGSKIKKKSEYPETFIDSRTGETINLDDINFDAYDNISKRGRGRGSRIKALTETNSQLQKQLRMARPLGSGDGAIESYCRRNRPSENLENISQIATNTVPEVLSETKAIPNQTVVQRVKATRNSSIQSNALIQNLLAKSKDNINQLGQTKEKNANFNVEKNLESNNFENLGEHIKQFFKMTDEYKLLRDDSTSFSYSCNAKSQDSVSENSNGSSESSSSSQNKNYNEIYKKLGERLNNFDRIQKNTFGQGIYDFSKATRYNSPMNSDCEWIEKPEEEISNDEENSNNYIFNEKTFPPLR